MQAAIKVQRKKKWVNRKRIKIGFLCLIQSKEKCVIVLLAIVLSEKCRWKPLKFFRIKVPIRSSKSILARNKFPSKKEQLYSTMISLILSSRQPAEDPVASKNCTKRCIYPWTMAKPTSKSTLVAIQIKLVWQNRDYWLSRSHMIK